MGIHWLADACVAAGLFSAVRLASSYWTSAAKPQPSEMRRSRLRAALEGSGTGAWVWELSSNHFLCDTLACRNLGARPGSILTLSDFLSCVAPLDRKRVEIEMGRASERDQAFALTVLILEPSGAERHIELTGRPETSDLGARLRLSGALRDVTNERRRSAEWRRQSQILAQVHDAIIAANLDGVILSWNAGAERTYGYETAEALQQPLGMLWYEEDRSTLQHELSAASLASGAHEFVSRVRHESGAELYAQFRLALMRDAEGTPIGLLACSHDVTHERQERETLTLQASVLESIDDAVVVTDKLERIVHSNAAALTLFGRYGARLEGLRLSSLFKGSNDDKGRLAREIRQALAMDHKWSGELTCGRGSRRDPFVARASVRSLALASGLRWVWVLHDVTEQRRSEAALKEREKRFRRLADSAPMMVWMTDADGACEYLNQAFLNHTSMTYEKARAVGWLSAFHPDDREALTRAIDTRNGPAEPFEMELRIQESGGDVRYALTQGAPRKEGGEVVGFVGSSLDITNIKKAEEERIALEQQALKSQKLHSLGVLAGGIAHDFNNMLVSILGFADLALRDLEPRHPARELVEQIELGAQRAAALVDQILTFAGKARRANDELDLNFVVLEMVHLLERTVGKNAAFDLDLADDLEPITGDPAQVRQVVMNLVLNASDALGESEGRIRVRTHQFAVEADMTHNWVGGDPPTPGAYVCLEVQDTGCGMKPDTLAQIFDPFFTTKFAGRGLGLSAVMGVVRSHSGAIQVESAPGEGCRFRVLFPVDRPPSNLTQQTHRGADGEPSVLIVDDDPTVLDATRQMLQSGGVKVYCAQTEDEAVSVFAEHSSRILLAILDVVMPDTNPARLASRLRSIRSDIRILFTSGFSDSGSHPGVDGHMVVGLLTKPYTRDRLLKAVAKACPAIVQDPARGAAAP